MFCSKIYILVIALLFSNVATAEEFYPYRSYSYDTAQECSDLDDPWEKLNRKIFIFNSVLDHFILKPITKGYMALFNDYTRDKIGNFVDNTSVPLTVVSNVMQLDPQNALKSFWQFVINTTLGVGGLYDVAGNFDMKTPPQTFGSMLAHYGVQPGPYIVLPIFGGSSMRDVLDAPILNNALNPVKYAMHKDFKLALTATTFVQKRAEFMPFTDYVEKNSSDPYTTIRSSSHQAREKSLRYPANHKCKRIYY
ncbi:MAG: MlaA family lipoprotein [Pseudomonadota bacterium]